jgi:adenosylhomocysteinase
MGAGEARIEWAAGQMPVVGSIGERFAKDKPLDGLKVAACLHVTAETANLVRALEAGGAKVELAASNPLSTQDDVAEALGVRARRGDDPAAGIEAAAKSKPLAAIDDGGDLILALHGAGIPDGFVGATEETTIGLVRLRALEGDGKLACPVLALNEAATERAFNDRYGTGQSTLDGILRATNLLLAGRTVVVLGYGYTGRGIALRARGAGAWVIVCEVDPLRALEARMEGYEVLPAIDAAERGDVFITVTGNRGVLRGEHFERMKDGAVIANAGHFDVEIDIGALGDAAAGPPEDVLPLVQRYELAGRKLNLLAGGRVVNLAAAQGHPAEVMDISFALQALAIEWLATREDGLEPGVVPVPEEIDRAVARLKLESLGVGIDDLTAEQRAYLSSWLR